MSVNLKVREYLLPARKVPSFHILLIGMVSCTLLGTRKLSLSWCRMFFNVLITLQHLPELRPFKRQSIGVIGH